jgi:hypothetical protein
MPIIVTFLFEGLCVFVPRKRVANPHMVVLFPNSEYRPGQGEYHGKAPVRHSAAVAIGGRSETLTGSNDWTGLVNGGYGPRIPGALPLTWLTGKPVSLALLQDSVATGPDAPLAARILLPLPSRKAIVGDLVAAEADFGGGRKEQLCPVSGLVRLTYYANRPFSIGNLNADDGDVIHVTHLPPGQVAGRHGSGDMLGHAHMHYRVFNGAAPMLNLREDYDSSSGPPVKFFSPGEKGVDPVVCTFGSGCPEDEPECGWG